MLEFFNITELIANYGYLGISAIVFLESGIFFALPGDSLLFSAGLLAASGILNIVYLIPLIFISTFLGALTGYEIGANLKVLKNWSIFKSLMKDEQLDKAHKFYDKYGKVTIIFSRFVPIVRTFAPIVAGVVKMHYREFLKYTLVGSLIWSTVVTLVGYFLGRAIPQIKDYISILLIAVVLLSFIPAIVEYIKDRRSTKKAVT